MMMKNMYHQSEYFLEIQHCLQSRINNRLYSFIIVIKNLHRLDKHRNYSVFFKDLLNKQKNPVGIFIVIGSFFLTVSFHSASNSNLLNRTNFHQGSDDAYAFKRFLFRHIEMALTDGWTNDGMSSGARSESSPFELSTYSIWKRLFTALRELLDTTPATNKSMRQAFTMLNANIDPDGQLSETRSKKYLPLAIKYYEEGLPARYTRHFHDQRVCR